METSKTTYVAKQSAVVLLTCGDWPFHFLPNHLKEILASMKVVNLQITISIIY